MQYLTYTEQDSATYDYCFLVPRIDSYEIHKNYIYPYGVDEKQVLVLDLYKGPTKKTPVKLMREHLEEVVEAILFKECKYVFVADADYFKLLAGVKQAELNLGYVLDSALGDFKVIYIPNFKQVFYDPLKIKNKIELGVCAVLAHQANTYVDPGKGIIHHCEYPQTYEEIKAVLTKLILWNKPLTADIEGFSLKHYDAGIGTIAFAWNQHEGVAFPVDLGLSSGPVRQLLKAFFKEFRNKIIWHNISYDVYVLVYQLFMEDALDTEGLLGGLDVMLKHWDDTKLITYLATNSCAGNKLGLKDIAQEFSGNYAVEEIKDITKIPLDELLQYNLVDCLSTWYAYNKHYQTMVDDNQLGIYQEIFKPAIWDIIQMQLTGLPLNQQKVVEAKAAMQQDQDNAVAAILSSAIIPEFEHNRSIMWAEKKNQTYKVKRVTHADCPPDEYRLNPGSDTQLQYLLYDMLDLPILDRTDSGLPSTGGKTLKKLIKLQKNEEIIELLEAVVAFKDVSIILNTFIPAFEAAYLAPDGCYYLFGNFNLGGTLSGRLSSSKPNLQNIPSSGTKYAKIIKQCFMAPDGWLFVGLDFASLEDRISALTTKDPNKLKVYTDGFDGHCLRAYSYFTEMMPDIDPNSVESINSIAKKYPDLRQQSKAPTFALTYQGTFVTLINNCGFSEELAKHIEKMYHNLYVISDQWVADKLKDASKVGYVTVAFGLRLRTPLLHQVVRGNRSTPFEAEAEGRTAGNALGQSWGLLNNRAASAFMKKVRKSQYKTNIKPCAHIHDAQYYLIKDDLETLLWMNKHLVKEVQWQDDPVIAHDEVKLGGELSVFYPSWAEEMTLPNDLTEAMLPDLIAKHNEKYKLSSHLEAA